MHLICTALLSCSPPREAALSSCHSHEAADVFLLLLSGRESAQGEIISWKLSRLSLEASASLYLFHFSLCQKPFVKPCSDCQPGAREAQVQNSDLSVEAGRREAKPFLPHTVCSARQQDQLQEKFLAFFFFVELKHCVSI